MPAIKEVMRWLPVIEEVRQELGVNASQYPDAVVLALIHVESAGNEWAHREGSRYYGLLQCARAYMMDAFRTDTANARDLQGDGRKSIECLIRYMERYQARHEYIPTLIAVAHKGGAGTVRTALDAYQSGHDINDAIEFAQDHHGVPRLKLYVERFRAALQNYAVAVEDLEKPYGGSCGDD